jgi:hypothetical protein
LKPEVLKKDAATAIADVTNRDARKALTVLYRNVKDGHVDPEIKKAMWKTLLLMKAYHFQNEHKRGHMICPSHDGSMVKKEPQVSAPAPVSRRQARRHRDGNRCADHDHHHHDPEQAQ